MNHLDLKIISCPGAKQFSSQIVKFLKKRNPKTRLVECDFPVFKNGETKTIIKEPIRGSDVYIIQDIANTKTGNIHDNIFQLFTAIDSCMHASCEEINVIIPTFPYARQHKKSQREGLTASLMCHILESMGVKRVITLDIHSREIQNSFSKTIMENLHASSQTIKEMIKKGIIPNNFVVVSPDEGSISRNTFFANALHVPLAMMYKERDYLKISKSSKDNNITSLKLIGDIDHNNILICDDMIDTGSTILKASKYLKSKGANDIYIVCSLPFFNDPAISDFEEAVDTGVIKGVFGTNAVYNPELWEKSWFYKVNVAELFADVIFRINEKISLSELLDSTEEIDSLLSGDE
jgi:ribose-phosphate pyrophosphokinase